MLRPPIVNGEADELPKLFRLNCDVPAELRPYLEPLERLGLTPLALPALPTLAGGMFILPTGPPAPGNGMRSNGASASAKAETLS